MEHHRGEALTWIPERQEGPVALTPEAEEALKEKYLKWCERQGGGDCLGLLDDGPYLRADDRRAFALALAFGSVLDETRDALKAELFSVPPSRCGGEERDAPPGRSRGGERGGGGRSGGRRGRRQETFAGLLRRTFAVDGLHLRQVWREARVLADVKQARGVRAIVEHLGLPPAGASLTPARAPPQGAGQA